MWTHRLVREGNASRPITFPPRPVNEALLFLAGLAIDVRRDDRHRVRFVTL